MTGGRSILVIRLGRLGDVILAAAATRELRSSWANARIDFAVLEPFREAADLLPGIDRVVSFPMTGLKQTFAHAKSELPGRYDLVVDLHGNPRSRTICAAVSSQETSRYKKDSVRRRLLVGAKLGKGSTTPVWRRYVEAACSHRAANCRPPRIRRTGGEGIRGAIGFAPGAGRATKQWPAESYAKLILLAAERFGRPLLLLGSAAEEPLLRRIEKSNPTAITVRAGGALAETATCLRQCELLVTGDSGLLHLSEAAGTPVVALFGPTTVELGFGPAGDRSAVLSENLDCRPCSLHGSAECPIPGRDHRCMTEISPDRVLDTMSQILDDRERGVG